MAQILICLSHIFKNGSAIIHWQCHKTLRAWMLHCPSHMYKDWLNQNFFRVSKFAIGLTHSMPAPQPEHMASLAHANCTISPTALSLLIVVHGFKQNSTVIQQVIFEVWRVLKYVEGTWGQALSGSCVICLH